MHVRVLIINNPNFDFLEGKLWLLPKFAVLKTSDHCGSFISNYDFKECNEEPVLGDNGW